MEPSKASSPFDDKSKEDDQRLNAHLLVNQLGTFKPDEADFSRLPRSNEPSVQQLLAANYQQINPQFTVNHPAANQPVDLLTNHPANHPVEQPPINRLPTNPFHHPPNQFQLNQPVNQYYWDMANYQRYNQQGYYFNYVPGYPYAGYPPNPFSQPPKSHQFDRSQPNQQQNLAADSHQFTGLSKSNLVEEASQRGSPTDRQLISESDQNSLIEKASKVEPDDRATSLNVIGANQIASQIVNQEQDAGSQANRTCASQFKVSDILQTLQCEPSTNREESLSNSLNCPSTQASLMQQNDRTQFHLDDLVQFNLDHLLQSTGCANNEILTAPMASSSSACSKNTQSSGGDTQSSNLSKNSQLSTVCSLSSLIRSPPMPSTPNFRTPVDAGPQSTTDEREERNSQNKFDETTQDLAIRSASNLAETCPSQSDPSQAPIVVSSTADRTTTVPEISFIENLKNAIAQKENTVIGRLTKDAEAGLNDSDGDERFDLREVDSNDDLKAHLKKLDRLLEIFRTLFKISEVLNGQIKDLSRRFLFFESEFLLSFLKFSG